MKLLVELEKGDKCTPIEMANALIRNYMDITEGLPVESVVIRMQEELAEIAEHIQVYLRYNRAPLDLGGVPLDGRA